MAIPDRMVLVPRWAVKALVGSATVQEQGRARRALADALNDATADTIPDEVFRKANEEA